MHTDSIEMDAFSPKRTLLYLQCKGSASKVLHQSALEGIYWSCWWQNHDHHHHRQLRFVKTLNAEMLLNVQPALRDNILIFWQVNFLAFFNKLWKKVVLILTWWSQRSTEPVVFQRFSGLCRSDPSPWLPPGPPLPATGPTHLKQDKIFMNVMYPQYPVIIL